MALVGQQQVLIFKIILLRTISPYHRLKSLITLAYQTWPVLSLPPVTMVSQNIPKLVMWRDLTPYPRRLIQAAATAPHVLIVGGGVTGLVTAWVLLDRGYKVR